MEFPVTVDSQDAFDRLVQSRLERERAKFADYDDLKSKVEGFGQTEAERQAEIDALTQRTEAAESWKSEREAADTLNTIRAEVATTVGVPADALRGSTKEELQAHAEALKPLLTAPRGPVLPTQGTTPEAKPESELRAFARGLFERAAD